MTFNRVILMLDFHPRQYREISNPMSKCIDFAFVR